jgi:hypothetical protein
VREAPAARVRSPPRQLRGFTQAAGCCTALLQALAAKQAARKYEAAKAALQQETAASMERVRSQAAAEVALAKRDAVSGVHVMLLMLRDGGHGSRPAEVVSSRSTKAAAAGASSAAQQVPAAASAAAADEGDAQAAGEGVPAEGQPWRRREQLACRFRPEEAAVVVQAHVRGHLARKQVREGERAQMGGSCMEAALH